MTNDRYERMAWDGLAWKVHADFRACLAAVVRVADAAGAPGGAALLQAKSGRRTVRVRDGWGAGRDAIVKDYRPRSLPEHVKYLLRPTRAAAEWAAGLALRGRGLPAALPLALGERRVLGVWRRSVLVLRALSGPTLYAWLREHRTGGAVRALAERTAECVARLHEAGFHHRDLHGENVMLDDGDGGAPVPHFVDLHEARRRGRALRRGACVDDLGRLNAYIDTPRRNRVRFLKRYLACRRLPAEAWRAWARAIDRRSRALWARSRRRHGQAIEKYR